MRFARFMELALYDPGHGYYSGGGAGPGPAGDFFTAADVGRWFGRCLARQVAEIDERIGPLEPFDLIEFGAGRGRLARDVVEALTESASGLAARLRYRMVDRSARMRERAARNAPAAGAYSKLWR